MKSDLGMSNASTSLTWHTYSLDDAGTREIDDALSLERRDGVDWIWIHIADPSRLIDIDSPLDQEARRRATSLYLAEGVMPMLPLELAAGPLSLQGWTALCSPQCGRSPR